MQYPHSRRGRSIQEKDSRGIMPRLLLISACDSFVTRYPSNSTYSSRTALGSTGAFAAFAAGAGSGVSS